MGRTLSPPVRPGGLRSAPLNTQTHLRKNQIIFAILLSALVPARAEIYGQSYLGIKDSLGRSGIYQILLNEGIDSVLNSINLSRNDVEVVEDTNLTWSDYSHIGSRPKDPDTFFKKLLIQKNNRNYKIFNSSSTTEQGIYTLSVTGKVVSLPANIPERTFSFNKSRKYNTVYENDLSNESKSFWDSTAKPILVTLGAVAVIALFFLVRG